MAQDTKFDTRLEEPLILSNTLRLLSSAAERQEASNPSRAELASVLRAARVGPAGSDSRTKDEPRRGAATPLGP